MPGYDRKNYGVPRFGRLNDPFGASNWFEAMADLDPLDSKGRLSPGSPLQRGWQIAQYESKRCRSPGVLNKRGGSSSPASAKSMMQSSSKGLCGA